MTLNDHTKKVLEEFRERFNIDYKLEVYGDYLDNIRISELEAFISQALKERDEVIVGILNKQRNSSIRLGKEAKKMMTATGIDKPIAMQEYWDFCIDESIKLIQSDKEGKA